MKRLYSFLLVFAFLSISCSSGKDSETEKIAKIENNVVSKNENARVSKLESARIDLNEAQKVAEKHIDLSKEKKYKEASNMVQHPVDYDQSDREIDLKVTELFYEEFGNIINYKYMSNQWHKPLFSKHWPPGKTPFVDKPKEIKEPPYLSLIYQIQYETLKMDKEIQVFKDGGVLKIQKVKDKANSFKAIRKMMNWIKRLPRKPNG